MNIDEQIKNLLELGFNIPFVEYYTHEGCNCYKMINPFTKFHQDKYVLCKVDEGFSKAIDIALELGKKKKEEFLNSK